MSYHASWSDSVARGKGTVSFNSPAAIYFTLRVELVVLRRLTAEETRRMACLLRLLARVLLVWSLLPVLYCIIYLGPSVGTFTSHLKLLRPKDRIGVQAKAVFRSSPCTLYLGVRDRGLQRSKSWAHKASTICNYELSLIRLLRSYPPGNPRNWCLVYYH